MNSVIVGETLFPVANSHSFFEGNKKMLILYLKYLLAHLTFLKLENVEWNCLKTALMTL